MRFLCVVREIMTDGFVIIGIVVLAWDLLDGYSLVSNLMARLLA